MCERSGIMRVVWSLGAALSSRSERRRERCESNERCAEFAGLILGLRNLGWFFGFGESRGDLFEGYQKQEKEKSGIFLKNYGNLFAPWRLLRMSKPHEHPQSHRHL